MIWHWFLQVTGISDEQGHWYAFWSGVGSDVGEVALLGGVLGLYRKHKCHEPRCYRLSKHPVTGTPYIVCRKHHPTVPTRLQRGEITQAHDRAQRIAAAVRRAAEPPPPEPAPRGRTRK